MELEKTPWNGRADEPQTMPEGTWMHLKLEEGFDCVRKISQD